MRWFFIYLLLGCRLSSNEAFVWPWRPKFASHGSYTALPKATPSPEQQPSQMHDESAAAGVEQLASWLIAKDESAESRLPLRLMKQTEAAIAVETLQSETDQAAGSALRPEVATPKTSGAALEAISACLSVGGLWPPRDGEEDECC